MANKIKDYLGAWQQRDNLLVSFNGGNESILRDKLYQRQKLKETDAFIRQQKKGKLNADEKAWLSLLKSGNRHLERQAYPNPVVRYGRRAVKAVTGVFRPVSRIRPRPQQRQPGNFPVLANNKAAGNVQKTVGQARSLQKKKEVKEVKRIVPKNRFAVIEGINKSKGRSL